MVGWGSPVLTLYLDPSRIPADTTDLPIPVILSAAAPTSGTVRAVWETKGGMT